LQETSHTLQQNAMIPLCFYYLKIDRKCKCRARHFARVNYFAIRR